MLLKEFYEDKQLLKAVKDYMDSFLRQEAVERVFNREQTMYLADAQEVIDKAFDNLDQMYSSEPKAVPPSPR